MWIKTCEEILVNSSKWDFIGLRSIQLDGEVICYEVYFYNNNGDEKTITCIKDNVEAEDFMEMIAFGDAFITRKYLETLHSIVYDTLQDKKELSAYGQEDHDFDKNSKYVIKILNSNRMTYGESKG